MSDRQDDDIEDEIIIEQEGDESESEPEEKVSKAEADDSDEGELESYSKGVQKRISRLTEKYRKEERDRQEAVRLAQQLLQEKQQLEGRLKQLDSGYLNEYGARIEAQVTAARRAYKDAYEAGDTDKMIEAQEALARATTDKQRYDLAKSRADERVQTTAAPPQQQYAAPQQQAVAQPTPRLVFTVSWSKKKVLTRRAMNTIVRSIAECVRSFRTSSKRRNLRGKVRSHPLALQHPAAQNRGAGP
jgi:hypothetical protein